MTELIQWRDDFQTGIASIDHEHKNMVDLINILASDLDSDTPESEIRHSLGRIHEMIEAHFALEEMLMQKHNYAEYRDHKADHDFLLDEILDIMDHIEEFKGTDFRSNLKERVSGWFGVHFSTFDRRLHDMVEFH